MIKSEGDSPSSCRASSMLSLHGISGALTSDDAIPSEALEEEAGAPLSKKLKMLPSRNEETFPSEVDDMYESNGSLNKGVEQGAEQFCVADVRKRLTDHLNTPKGMFNRDPEDPSG